MLLYVVTNRKLTKNFNDFIERIKILNAANIDGIILREKDLSNDEYEFLAKKIFTITKNLIINNNIDVAHKLNIENIQLSFQTFKYNYHYLNNNFKKIIVSVHNINEAIYASKKGATYIILGHIFQTKCKDKLKPLGTNILKNICKNVSKPILAIGGINNNNIYDIFKNGAKGVCLMSEIMETKTLKDTINKYKKIVVNNNEI